MMSRWKIVRFVRILLCGLLFGSGWVSPASAQRNGFNLSLWPPLSTQKTDSASSSWGTLGVYAKTNRLRGGGLTLLALRSRTADGVTLSGFTTVTGKGASGVQLSGLFNVDGGDFSGFQSSALLNLTVGRMSGVMLSASTNIVVTEVSGVQFAGAANVAGKKISGVQLAGGTNIALSSGRLTQLSILANICVDTLNGVQIGVSNYASSVNGLQVGLVNICGGPTKGAQFGLVNKSEDTLSLKIGLVNINPHTRTQLMVFGGTSTKVNVAVRFKDRHSYTILGIGTHYLPIDEKFSGSLFYRIGLSLPLNRRFELSADGGFFHIENFNNACSVTPERMYSLQARLNLEYRPLSRFALFVSGGYAHTRFYRHNRVFESEPLAELGVILF